MATSLWGTSKDILRPWSARLIVGVPLATGLYQFGCDQFGLPTLPQAWQKTGAFLPWWGWLVVAQIGFTYALLHRVRRLPTVDADELDRLTERLKRAEERLDGAKPAIAVGRAGSRDASKMWERGLYVGDPSIGVAKLEEEHWFEFAFRVFNGTGHTLTVASAEGQIEAAILAGDSIPEENKFMLPPPALLRDRSNLQEIEPFTEFLIVLQQSVSPAVLERMKAALEDKGMQFYFDHLKVTLVDLHDRAKTVELSIAMGAYLRRRMDLVAGRVTRARVGAATQVNVSGPAG